MEYAFGSASQQNNGGVYTQIPKQVPSGGAPGAPMWSKTIEIGTVEMNISDWKSKLSLGRAAFPGTRYDLLDCNCNHFSDSFLKTLNPEWELPSYLNRGAKVGSSITSKLASILPSRASPFASITCNSLKHCSL